MCGHVLGCNARVSGFALINLLAAVDIVFVVSNRQPILIKAIIKRNQLN